MFLSFVFICLKQDRQVLPRLALRAPTPGDHHPVPATREGDPPRRALRSLEEVARVGDLRIGRVRRLHFHWGMEIHISVRVHLLLDVDGKVPDAKKATDAFGHLTYPSNSSSTLRTIQSG